MPEFRATEVLFVHILKDDINQIHYQPCCHCSQKKHGYIETLIMDYDFN